MALSSQASRLLKRNYDDPILAQEIYTMFLADTPDSTGALSVNLARLNGATIFTAPAVENLAIQAVDLDGATSVEIVRESSVANTQLAGAGNLKSTTRPFTQRSCLLGKIISFQSGPGTYTVDLYPNGTNATALRVTGVVPLVEPGGAGVQIPNDTWLDVFRVSEAEAVTKEFFDPSGLIFSKTTTIDLIVEKHYVINPEIVVTGDLAIPGHLTLSTDKRIFFRDAGLSIHSDADGLLRIEADGTIRLAIGGSERVSINSSEINIQGAINHDGTTAGFFGKTPVTKRTAPGNPSVSLPADFAGCLANDNAMVTAINALILGLDQLGLFD